MEVLHQASSLFGPSFRNALNLIEKTPDRMEVYDYDHLYVLVVNT